MAKNKKEEKNLLSQLGLENLNEEEKAEILLKIGELVQKRAIARILDEMSEEEAKDFSSFLEDRKNGPGEIEEYLRNNVSNFEEIIEEEAKSVREDLISQLGDQI